MNSKLINCKSRRWGPGRCHPDSFRSLSFCRKHCCRALFLLSLPPCALLETWFSRKKENHEQTSEIQRQETGLLQPQWGAKYCRGDLLNSWLLKRILLRLKRKARLDERELTLRWENLGEHALLSRG